MASVVEISTGLERSCWSPGVVGIRIQEPGLASWRSVTFYANSIYPNSEIFLNETGKQEKLFLEESAKRPGFSRQS